MSKIRQVVEDATTLKIQNPGMDAKEIGEILNTPTPVGCEDIVRNVIEKVADSGSIRHEAAKTSSAMSGASIAGF